MDLPVWVLHAVGHVGWTDVDLVDLPTMDLVYQPDIDIIDLFVIDLVDLSVVS